MNTEYDPIRVQALGKDLIPSLEEAYAHVQQEESRKIAMLYTAPMDKVGMVASFEAPKVTTSEKDYLHYDYCGKPRHTNKTCWKLHRRPTRGHGGKRPPSTKAQANGLEAIESSTKIVSNEPLFAHDIEKLKRLLSHLDSSSNATSNFVKSGNVSYLTSWIIDSEKNRHMTSFSKGFIDYSPCLIKDNVKIDDGLLTPISRTGSVACTPHIKLSSVHHVPCFFSNLLSVSVITKALNCKIEFFSKHFVFQSFKQGRILAMVGCMMAYMC